MGGIERKSTSKPIKAKQIRIKSDTNTMNTFDFEMDGKKFQVM